MDAWVDSEVSNCEFPDQRLKRRFSELLSSLGRRVGDSIPLACLDWAATKAAYRFFSNRRVDEHCILSGHFAATASRFAATASRFAATASRFAQASGTVLVLHDTTEFSFQREHPEKVGKLNVTQTR